MHVTYGTNHSTYRNQLSVWDEDDEQPRRRWWQRSYVARPAWIVPIPYSMCGAAEALAQCAGPAEPLAQTALYEMAKDCRRFALNGSTSDMEWKAAGHWDAVVKRIHDQFVNGDHPGADRIELLLKALEEMPDQDLVKEVS